MKFILSRKGFDSELGGKPSPILPDGRMISLPIPSDDPIPYSNLKINYRQYKTYFDLMKVLIPKIKIGKDSIEINREARCHMDPDLYKETMSRQKDWRPLFGQIGAAQRHLENMGVEKDDIFLFFGTFRHVAEFNNKLSFDKTDKDRHIIFGYLQIGKILKMDNIVKPEKWMKYHPHCDIEKRRGRNNTIYVGREKLSWNDAISGSGVFNYDDSLVLSKKGGTKSLWCLDPTIFKGIQISYHTEKSWGKNFFQSTGRGQEFVVEENKNVEMYFRDLIKKNIFK